MTRWVALLSFLALSALGLPEARAKGRDTVLARAPSEPSGPQAAEEAPRAAQDIAPPASEEPRAASDEARRAATAKPRVLDLSVNLTRGLFWDLSLQGGVGVPLGGDLDRHGRFMGRLRAGLLLASEPLFVGLGATGELGGLVGAGGGLQVEVLNAYSGLSAQAGVAYGGDRRLTTHVGVGLAIFAVEWTHSYESRPEARNALFFKLSLPIGVIVQMRPRRARSDPPSSPR